MFRARKYFDAQRPTAGESVKQIEEIISASGKLIDGLYNFNGVGWSVFCTTFMMKKGKSDSFKFCSDLGDKLDDLRDVLFDCRVYMLSEKRRKRQHQETATRNLFVMRLGRIYQALKRPELTTTNEHRNQFIHDILLALNIIEPPGEALGIDYIRKILKTLPEK